MNINVFEDQHLKYFLYLEKEVMSTFEYSTLDIMNKNNFSFKYINLLQAICSEFEVVAKAYCELLNEPDADSILKYGKVIIGKHPGITTKNVTCYENSNLIYVPFQDWVIPTAGNKSEKPPKWWTIYNKIKHNRLALNNDGEYKGIENYKLANQDNVMNALAGLYLLEMYFFKDLTLKSPNVASDIYIPTGQYVSNLFDLPNWSSTISIGPLIINNI